MGVVALSWLIGCGGSNDPRCTARKELREAARLVTAADAAQSSGDTEAVRQSMQEAEGLVAGARTRLLAADPTGSDGVTRRLLEGANYLTFISESYRAGGGVEGSLVQFASRELDRPNLGENKPLNC